MVWPAARFDGTGGIAEEAAELARSATAARKFGTDERAPIVSSLDEADEDEVEAARIAQAQTEAEAVALAEQAAQAQVRLFVNDGPPIYAPELD